MKAIQRPAKMIAVQTRRDEPARPRSTRVLPPASQNSPSRRSGAWIVAVQHVVAANAAREDGPRTVLRLDGLELESATLLGAGAIIVGGSIWLRTQSAWHGILPGIEIGPARHGAVAEGVAGLLARVHARHVEAGRAVGVDEGGEAFEVLVDGVLVADEDVGRQAGLHGGQGLWGQLAFA